MDEISQKNNYVTNMELNIAIDPLKADVGTLKKDVSILKKDVSTLKSDVAILKKSVLNIESKINIYSDMYEVNKWNSEKLANRVNKLEKHTGVTPPQEFLISGI